MSDNLNLLRSRKKDRQEGQLRLIRFLSYGSLFIILISSIALFFLKINLGISDLKKQERSISNSLSLMSGKIVKFIMLKNRMTESTAILDNRTDFSEIIDEAVKDKPESLSVESFSLDKAGLLLNISSSSLTDLDLFLNNLQKEPGFKKITLENFTLDEMAGSYKLSLKIALNE